MPPLFLTVAVVCSCGLVLLVIGVFILGLVLRRRNAQPHGGGGND
jgi:cytochrome c-type biogenesis protein CcmH/NrfF